MNIAFYLICDIDWCWAGMWWWEWGSLWARLRGYWGHWNCMISFDFSTRWCCCQSWCTIFMHWRPWGCCWFWVCPCDYFLIIIHWFYFQDRQNARFCLVLLNLSHATLKLSFEKTHHYLFKMMSCEQRTQPWVNGYFIKVFFYYISMDPFFNSLSKWSNYPNKNFLILFGYFRDFGQIFLDALFT